MRTLRLWVVAFTGICASTVLSHAWSYNVEEPDVFGVKKFFASDAKLRESLVVQCGSKEFMALAYIYKIKPFSEVESSSAKLFVKGNSSNPIIVNAVRSKWNDNYGGIVALVEKDEIRLLIEEIRDARNKIQVGVQVEGNQFSAVFSSRGSTKSMQAAISTCKLDIAN